MFYIGNVSNWFNEIIQNIQLKQLSVKDSNFMLVLFSSFDFEIVDFFKRYKSQISSYSGKNFHIFTPIVYQENTIPDEEWRRLRDEFNEMGIRISNRPSVILFNIKEENNNRKFTPNIYGAYNLNYSENFNYLIQDIIDFCIRKNGSDIQLSFELEKLFMSPNIVREYSIKKYSIMDRISEELEMPKLFLSHSSADKIFVRKLSESLIKNEIKVWIDENEILVGDSIKNKLEDAISDTDYLLFVISNNSVKSDWVKYELHSFLNKYNSERLLPIVLDDSFKKIPDVLNKIKSLKYLDFSNKSNWNKNVEEIVKKVRGG